MQSSQVQGRWSEVKGKIKQVWGDLTDDEIAQAEGRLEELVGKIQRKYGGSREEILRRLEHL